MIKRLLLLVLTSLLLGSTYSIAQHAAPPRGVTLAPMYQMSTTDGRRLARGDLQRRPFIVFFGFTHCPDVCPTTLLVLSMLLEKLGPDAEKLKVFFVSVDPDRDTPEHLKSYMTSFDPRISALTGSPLDVAAVAHAFDAFYERVPGTDGRYSFDHTTKIYMMDRFGLMAAAVDPQTDLDRTEKLLRKVLAQ
jgi:protein SCO1